jgi:hypothetical protein
MEISMSVRFTAPSLGKSEYTVLLGYLWGGGGLESTVDEDLLRAARP